MVRRGEVEEAVRLARDSIEMAKRTHEALTLPNLLISQAEVLGMAERPADAAAALRQAADLATRKGALVEERRAKERLAAFTASA